MPESTPAHTVQGDEKEHGAQRFLKGLGKVLKPHAKSPPPPHEAQTPVAAQAVAASAGAPAAPPAGVKDEWSPDYIANNLPSYALKHAPFVYLDKGEEFWPGNPIRHLEHCAPQTEEGVKLDINERGIEMLNNGRIRDDWNTYMVLVDADPRQTPAQKIEALTSRDGIPDESRRSASTAYIITVDKSPELGAGFVDVFYFYFYPYNYGAAVVGIHFGNHVGDWEHTMVRFRFGVPVYVHMSAHSDGHSYKIEMLEKLDGRPVVYSARGSHAHYATTGSHSYSGIPGGPVDYTSKGPLWDPTLNFISVNHKYQDGSWSTHKPWPRAPNAKCEPFPTETQATNILRFQGRWGNSFHEYRRAAPAGQTPTTAIGKIGQKFEWLKDKVEDGVHRGEAKTAAENPNEISVDQKYYKLVWGEGPTGPRDKSLNRSTMNRNSNTIMDKL